MTDYRAIINKKRPEHINDDFSVRHQKMPRSKRAKLFMPFDALSGFDERMDEETVDTVHPAEISDELSTELDGKIRALHESLRELPPKKTGRKGLFVISILFFERNSEQEMLKNDGIRGNYRWISGSLTDIDDTDKSLEIDYVRYPICFIYAIEY